MREKPHLAVLLAVPGDLELQADPLSGQRPTTQTGEDQNISVPVEEGGEVLAQVG